MKAASGFALRTILAAAAVLAPLLSFAAAAADVTGTWVMTVETPAGSGNPTFKLTQNGEAITGTYTGRFGEAPVTGTVEGDHVTLRFTVTFEAQEIKIEYTGTLEGDTMTGKVVLGGIGEGTFKGTRSRP